METLEGNLLLASPKLQDPNFVQTVVLLIEHNDQGAIGLVLNRPTSKTVQELWSQVGQSGCESRQPVHLGGPVSGPLMAVHTVASCGEVEVVPGVFVAAKKKNLDQLVHQHDQIYRVFIGHAGWGPGQLEAEMAQKAWLAVPATAERVFAEAEDMWQRLVKQLDNYFFPKLLHIKHVPPDPSMN
jgi:putative transcriptional regulator